MSCLSQTVRVQRSLLARAASKATKKPWKPGQISIWLRGHRNPKPKFPFVFCTDFQWKSVQISIFLILMEISSNISSCFGQLAHASNLKNIRGQLRDRMRHTRWGTPDVKERSERSEGVSLHDTPDVQHQAYDTCGKKYAAMSWSWLGLVPEVEPPLALVPASPAWASKRKCQRSNHSFRTI